MQDDPDQIDLQPNDAGQNASGQEVSGQEVSGQLEIDEGDNGRTDGGFSVRLTNFEGPFDLLLQLISKHKLDITEVALSRVTDEFIAHIKAAGDDWDLEQTSQFIVVAATLLDLKAARLLPSGEVTDPEDLALLEARDLLFARLLQYRAFKQIAAGFGEQLEVQARRRPRTAGLEDWLTKLLPEITIKISLERFAELAARAMTPKQADVVSLAHLHSPAVTVREQGGIIVDRLKITGQLTFAELTKDSPDRITTVCRFLALLELFREKAISFEQPTPLDALTIRWTGSADQQVTISDEFDTPPEQPDDDDSTTENEGSDD
ncbi:condensin subunit ScpA [Microlunatus soli]|uniref:Segregation and condensation protein A n=2 Tax=Microlunatus soli TaxID=630515 RepID=A0A1H1XZX8_9ACTN|nr:condensin subunit ScpA [Microlunatus soli]